MSPSFREEDIPVLTEVIAETEPPLPPASATAPAPPSTSALSPASAPTWTEADRDALERRLQERILRQLQGHIDIVLEQQVRDVLADVLQTAVSRLAEDIRSELQASMERIVAQAVAQEVARLPRHGDDPQ